MVSRSGFIRRMVVGTECCASYQTSAGNLYIISDAEAITAILYASPAGQCLKMQSTALTDIAARQIQEYLRGARTRFDLPLKPAGTAFQQELWAQIMNIPYGETRNYRELAISAGNVRAVRAVAQVVNRNPIALVIPCHRVLGCNGKLINYPGGLKIKEQLLLLEKS